MSILIKYTGEKFIAFKDMGEKPDQTVHKTIGIRMHIVVRNPRYTKWSKHFNSEEGVVEVEVYESKGYEDAYRDVGYLFWRKYRPQIEVENNELNWNKKDNYIILKDSEVEFKEMTDYPNNNGIRKAYLI